VVSHFPIRRKAAAFAVIVGAAAVFSGVLVASVSAAAHRVHARLHIAP
jgi:hypothetical protein